MMSSVTLTAYNMSNISESEFYDWVLFVSNHINSITGLSVSVDSFDFSNGPSSDRICGLDHEVVNIHEALEYLWQEYCN